MAPKYDQKIIIKEFYNKYIHLGKSYVANHFIAEGFAKTTVYRIIALVENEKSLERKIGSGRPAKFSTKPMIKRLQNYFNHHSGRSKRKFTRKVEWHQSTVSKILKNSTLIRVFRKPRRTPF